MIEGLCYLFEAACVLGVLHLVYRYLFARLTHFKWNRFYLLSGLAIALLLPAIRVEIDLGIAGSGGDFFEEVVWEQATAMDAWDKDIIRSESSAGQEISKSLQGDLILLCLFWLAGVISQMLSFSRRLLKVRKIYQQSDKLKYGKQEIVLLPPGTGAFSFFGWIFMDPRDLCSGQILEHERAHSKQAHSLDLLFLESVFIFLWFYPFKKILRRGMRLNHEFLADAAVVSGGGRIGYSKLLFGLATEKPSSNTMPVQAFAATQVSKRIAMLHTQPSKRMTKLKYLLVLPLLGLLFSAFSVVPDNTYMQLENHAAPQYWEDPPAILPLELNAKFRITSNFGTRVHPITGESVHHDGIDLAAELGTEIIAPADGIVIDSDFSENRGNYLLIRHDKHYETHYSHLQKQAVSVGKSVKKGEIIGYVGNTGKSLGAHLHYEVRRDGKAVDPKDYMD